MKLVVAFLGLLLFCMLIWITVLGLWTLVHLLLLMTICFLIFYFLIILLITKDEPDDT